MIERIPVGKLKSAFRRASYPVYAATQVGMRLAMGLRNLQALVRSTGARPLWEFEMPSPGERPAFILGSGASVHDYREPDWNAIRAGVSIGINRWVLHEFVPSILMFEIIGLDEAFFKVLRAREREYAETTLIIRGNYLRRRVYLDYADLARQIPQRLRERTFISWDFPVPGHTSREFERSLQWLDRAGHFKSGSRSRTTGQSRASLGYAVNFTVQRGFREIVLCGVDLNNTNYFYETPSSRFAEWGVAQPDSGQRGAVHLTNDPAVGELTVSDALRSTSRLILAPRGIKLFVGSKKSALFPSFPCYFDRDL